jgi:hypothetical protein
MNKICIFFLLTSFIFSCSENAGQKSVIANESGKKIGNTIAGDGSSGSMDSLAFEEEDGDYSLFHIISIAESYSYDSLHRLGESLSKKMDVKLETMGRVYDPEKGVVVSMDDEDEMYRGEYYPRRFSGDFLSIEMKYSFSDSSEKINANDLKMVLIGGIFEKQQQADSVFRIIKASYPGARLFANELYIGCMH